MVPNFDRKLRQSPWFVIGIELTPGTAVSAPMRMPEIPRAHPMALADPRIWTLPYEVVGRIMTALDQADRRRGGW